MANEDHNIVRVYRIHARSNGHDCITPWFLDRKQAEDYPDSNWTNRETEDRRAILVGDEKHVFVASDLGLYNPDHEAPETEAKTG